MGVGMIVCGAVTDRLSRHVAIRKWTTAIVYSAVSLVFLGVGFSLPPGGAQLLLLAVGIFFAAGTAGPAGAMVVQPDPRVDPGHRASAPSPWPTTCSAWPPGRWSPASSPTGSAWSTAMKIVPLAAVGALVALLHRPQAYYPRSLAKVNAPAVTR